MKEEWKFSRGVRNTVLENCVCARLDKDEITSIKHIRRNC